ncbi:MAG TPA: MoaF N-terminal domain-containing protein [Gammaproteobacteria bacterium]
MQRLCILLCVLVFAFEAWAEPAASTRKLDGTEITYTYTGGRSYNVRYAREGVSYRYLSGSKPEKWWGPFPYQAFEVRADVFFLSWFEPGWGDYVTLLLDFNKTLYGSAILEGKEVHFQGALIEKSER